MPRFALIRPHDVPTCKHASIELDRDDLYIGGEARRRINMRACSYRFRDATARGRFVEQLTVYCSHGDEQFITSPANGAIAPRGARLPDAPASAWVLSREDFVALRLWLARRGHLDRLTIGELAELCVRATSNFAVELGEWAALRAVEMTWERRGPLRGGVRIRDALAPLIEAGCYSERAHEAVIAALAKASAA